MFDIIVFDLDLDSAGIQVDVWHTSLSRTPF